MLRLSALAGLALAVWFFPAGIARAEEPAGKLPPPLKRKVDFEKDVRPIFVRSCYSCHGPEEQEGGLRLDRRQDALAGGDSGPVIVPHKSAQSRLIRVVAGLDDELGPMPPEGEGTPLKKEEIALLRAWIDQGAPWPQQADQSRRQSKHWAFQPIVRPKPPRVKNTAWVRNPIDAFILARLEKEGIAPSPEADRYTLIRRVYLDVLGLPPSPEEIEAFVNDPRPDAYERMVDRALASPHYGERWGRHWLDLARYADSDGYEKDRPRPWAWRYREWVIRALNADMPFDQFTIEQLAGDLLPNPTIEQRVATGFHRNTLTNREGGVDREEDRVKQTVDRTNTTGTVWLGLTIECGQCHSHKYDPITQREYYQLYAFFNSLEERDIPAPLDPKVEEEYQRKLKSYQQQLAQLKARVEKYKKEQLPARLAQWLKKPHQSKIAWQVVPPAQVRSENGATLTTGEDAAVLATGKNPERDIYHVEFELPLGRLTGVRLEVLPDKRLPSKGPGRVAHGNFVLSELELYRLDAQGKRHRLKLAKAQADFSQTHKPPRRSWPVAAAIDGKPGTGWAIAPRFGQRHVAVFTLAEPVVISPGEKLLVVMKQLYGSQHTIGKFRFSFTDQDGPLPLEGLPSDVAALLGKPLDKLSPAEKQKLLDYYAKVDPGLQRLQRELQRLEKNPPKRSDPTMAQTLVERTPRRKTHLLIRGDFLRPGPEVQPDVPEVLPPLKVPPGRVPNRLDLARWLVSPENPLTARVTVNRVWQRYFGRGIVETSHDFGTMGSPPSHPMLLDWLAHYFMHDARWSMKRLHRLILTSATYRQSSKTRPELKQRDPYNKLLAYQNRLRVEAEIIRDLALTASGLLERRIGGPSIRPPQPKDIAMLGYANQVKWKESQGADRYRRGVYIFFQRTVPFPMLMDFDAPDSVKCCTRRERSNTPIGALALQNDPTFVECARVLGRRLMREVPQGASEEETVRQRIVRAFLLTLGRPPAEDELQTIRQLYREAYQEFRHTPQDAAAYAGVDPKDKDHAARVAAWVLVARTMMNLDGFITRD